MDRPESVAFTFHDTEPDLFESESSSESDEEP